MKKIITTGIILLLGVGAVMAKGVPMDIKLERTDKAEEVTLEKLSEGKKGVLIDFWATWCGPCMRLMPHLKETGEQMKEDGIVVVGMNVDSKNKAEAVRVGQGIELDWLVDSKKNPYQKYFGIRGIPHMVLLDSDGNVLFKGHPNDRKLQKALAELKSGKSSVKS